MQNIIFATDSACDIPQKFLEENDIIVLPYHISFGDEELIDGITVTRDVLYKKVKETGELPKTAAISPGEFSDFFKPLSEKADAVVYFSLGSHFSSACQNAMLGAAAFDNVYVVDTNSLSAGMAVILLHAITLRSTGMDAKSISEDCAEFSKHVDVSFVLDQLTFIHKGGRCSGTAALGANLLGIKPCLSITDGVLDVGKKYKGKMKIVVSKYIRERLEGCTPDPAFVFLADSGVEPEVWDAAHETLKELGIFKEIIQVDAGCVISCHCGPGTLGILFAKN